MENFSKKEGFVLYFVLGIILAITLLFNSLIEFPRSFSNVVKREQKYWNEYYLAESAILLKMENYPENFFPESLNVSKIVSGPWEKSCVKINKTNSLCVIAGTAFKEVPFEEWIKETDLYRRNLKKRILKNKQLKETSGNRRIFIAKKNIAEYIRNGDLKMNFKGHIQSAEFIIEGDAYIQGNNHFDTLRIYTEGNLYLQDSVSVNYMEAVSGGIFFAQDNAKYRGFNLSNDFVLEGKSKGIYPTLVIATSLNAQGVIRSKADVKGNAFTLQNTRNFKSNLNDSANLILPAFIKGNSVIWDWARE